MEPYKGTVLLKLEGNAEHGFKIKRLEYDDKSSNLEITEEIYTLSELFTSQLNCNTEQITVLNLHNCDIHNVPSCIQKLKLKQLILSDNKLSEVPALLYTGLASLELLDLSGNFIKNFDIEPACWPILKILNLNNNAMHSVPQWVLIGQGRNLLEFSFSQNHTAHLVLRSYHKFQLKTVEMCNACLRDNHLKFFSILESLQSLDLSNHNTNATKKSENFFDDIDRLFQTAKWTNLTKLNLNYLMISVMPKNLFCFKTIRELSMIGCDLSWIPEEIHYLTELELIDVSKNFICSLPPELCSLPKLKSLKAAYNYISIVSPLSLSINILDLYQNQLDTLPIGVENIEFIDLEQNSLSLLSENWYKNGLDKMRKLLISQDDKETRINGILLPVSVPNDHFDLTDDDEDDGNSESCSIRNRADIIEENWDYDEVEIDTNYVRNPEITTSDEEWEGYEQIQEKTIRSDGEKKSSPPHDFDELLFCDV